MIKDLFLSVKESPIRRRRLIYALIGILVLSFVLFSDSGLINRFSLESEKSELKLKIIHAKSRKDSLKNRIDVLNSDDKEIEKVAREKYGMKKKGETIYLIEENSDNK